jgi:bifunctional enzyme CysN/CysC
MSARFGDNVTPDAERQYGLVRRPAAAALSRNRIEVGDRTAPQKPFRFPVQWVNRPNLDFRGFRRHRRLRHRRVGDEVVVAPSRASVKVTRASSPWTATSSRRRGQAVTLVLDRRGRGLARRRAGAPRRPNTADQFQARIVWIRRAAVARPRSYPAQDRDSRYRAHRHRSQIPHQRQHASSPARPRRWN